MSFPKPYQHFLQLTIITLLSGLLYSACQSNKTSTPKQESPDFSMPKFDVHAHYRFDQTFLQPLLEEWNMNAMIVQVARGEIEESRQRWETIKDHSAQYPDRFVMCTGFQAKGIDQADYAEKIIQQIKKDIADGALAVKVWKNFGMVDKDASGQYVQIDDERLQAIWDYLIAEGVPVLAHIGEPLQAFRPLVKEERNPHFNYFSNNPQYHAYQHPEIPRWETIMEARDNWLARNPDLIVIGAHMGSMSHDVDEVAKRLDRFPNFYVEPAARFGDLVRQDSKKVRDFFLKYQDRIMYGTDLSTNLPADEQTVEAKENRKQFTKRLIELHWQYFSGSDSLYYDSPMISFPTPTHSLNLPDSVLRKVYWENAREILKFDEVPIHSQVFRWNELEVAKENTRERRQILEGLTDHFSYFEIHATTIQPEKTPHPSHTHEDMEELIIIKEGELKISIKDKSQVLGPGSIALAIPGEEHGLQNVGETPASYYIIRYRSKSPMDISRGKEAGGSFWVDWNDLEFKEQEKGGVRSYFNRPTAMCSYFEMHVTTLKEGKKSHDPHTHIAEEIILPIQGDVEEHIDGKDFKATQGDLIFLASEIPHGIRNDGKGEAIYFAFQWR